MRPETSQKSLSWAERPLAELTRLAWPIAVSMLSYSTMTLVDTFFVARLGAPALAGVGVGGIMVFTLMCFPMGLLRATKVLVSQAIGADQRDQVGPYQGAALLLAMIFGVALFGLGMLATTLGGLRSFAASAEASTALEQYFGLRSLAVPLVLFHVALREVRYGVGDSRRPMYAALLANGVNIVLDAGLIVGLDMGVVGAAWASNVAQLVELGVLLLALRRHGPQVCRPRRAHLHALWRLGLPSGLQFSLEIGSFAMLAAMIARYSDVEMAAHQITLQVVHFSFLPGFALGDACSVLTGQAVGASRFDLVGTVARRALVAVMLYMGGCGIVFVVAGTWIASGFTDDPQVLAISARLFVLAALFQLFDGANMVARGALRGTGDVKVPAWICVLLAWACTPPLMWLLGYRLQMGALGGWIGICLELVVGSLILWWRLTRGHWHAAARQTQIDREDAARESVLHGDLQTSAQPSA